MVIISDKEPKILKGESAVSLINGAEKIGYSHVKD